MCAANLYVVVTRWQVCGGDQGGAEDSVVDRRGFGRLEALHVQPEHLRTRRLSHTHAKSRGGGMGSCWAAVSVTSHSGARSREDPGTCTASM